MTELRVGQIARRTREVAARDIELFTELTGDRNPLHYDEALASRSRFGGIIVQGGVTSGLLNAVVAEDLPGPGSVFLHVDWSFRAPVRPGDTITAEVEVLEVRRDVQEPLRQHDRQRLRLVGTVGLEPPGGEEVRRSRRLRPRSPGRHADGSRSDRHGQRDPLPPGGDSLERRPRRA